jgi:hypothetical protein
VEETMLRTQISALKKQISSMSEMSNRPIVTLILEEEEDSDTEDLMEEVSITIV